MIAVSTEHRWGGSNHRGLIFGSGEGVEGKRKGSTLILFGVGKAKTDRSQMGGAGGGSGEEIRREERADQALKG